MAVSSSVSETTILKTSGSWTDTSLSPDSEALDRAEVRPTSTASQAHSYRRRLPCVKGDGGDWREMSRDVLQRRVGRSAEGEAGV